MYISNIIMFITELFLDYILLMKHHRLINYTLEHR